MIYQQETRDKNLMSGKYSSVREKESPGILTVNLS